MTSLRQSALLLGAIAVVLFVIAGIAIFGNTRPGARAEILGPRRAEPGEVVPYRISVRDTEGVLRRIELEFGDGDDTVYEPDETPECDGPSTQDVEIDHTYERRGVFTARARVTTGGCGAATEVIDAVRTVSVRPLNLRQ